MKHYAAAARFRAAAVFAATLLLISCGKADDAANESPREGFAVPPGGSLVLIVGGDGSIEPARAAADGSTNLRRAGSPQPFPMAVTAASIQPLPGGAVVAVNRTGIRWLRVTRHPAVPAASDKAAARPAETRLAIGPVPGAEQEFEGRTVAPSWARGGEALFLLYRHPIFEMRPPRTPASVVVAATIAGARVAEPGIGDDAYALFPVSADSWLAQYRSETSDRVTTRYARISAAGDPAVPLTRAEFEKLASPVPLAAAPEPLRAAAAALSGPLLVEARLADGSRRSYVRGDPGQAAPAWAHVPAEATGSVSACVVTDDWRVSVAGPDGQAFWATTAYPPAPVPGARVRDAALVDGLVVALWEEDLFPDAGASGLFILDPGL